VKKTNENKRGIGGPFDSPKQLAEERAIADSPYRPLDKPYAEVRRGSGKTKKD
jgi:hypothetical protein